MHVHMSPTAKIHYNVFQKVDQRIFNFFTARISRNLLKILQKNSSIPKTCRCITFRNIHVRKLHQLKHSSSKLSAHELKKMWSI